MSSSQTNENNTGIDSQLLLIVTGASRGFGRAVAEAFCCRHAETKLQLFDRIAVYLIARSVTGLEETHAALLERTGFEDSACKISVTLMPMDLNNLETLEDNLTRFLENEKFLVDLKCSRYCIFVNNAGSLGPLGPCLDSVCNPSLREMQRAVDLNVTSSLWMSVQVARAFQRYAVVSACCWIVNVSSLVAIQPFATMALYSAGKAARDAYHIAMAQEIQEAASSSSSSSGTSSMGVNILNYAPGPLETDMTEEIRAAEQLSANLKPHYQKELVDPMDTARTLVDYVFSVSRGESSKISFQNGLHIDYYDLINTSS